MATLASKNTAVFYCTLQTLHSFGYVINKITEFYSGKSHREYSKCNCLQMATKQSVLQKQSCYTYSPQLEMTTFSDGFPDFVPTDYKQNVCKLIHFWAAVIKNIHIRDQKGVYAFSATISEGHLAYGSHIPVTLHSWTCPALTLATQANTRFTYPAGMKGWVDWSSLIWN